ncbi:hypothetical protein QFZ43_001565 [Streptomyces afghaniensis]|nr:hypothetical protein [Streptomyces afghaniensis]
MGAPRATLDVHSPKDERTQDCADAADKLVLFAKIYDVAPDGTRTLVRRLVAPVRVPDVTNSFNRGTRPVTVAGGAREPGVLRLPVAGS